MAFENAEELSIFGAEFDALVQLLPKLTNNGLVLTVGAAWLDSEYTTYPNAKGYNDAGVFSQGNDYTGNRVVQTPEYTVTIGLNQSFFYNNSTLEIGLNYYYNSGYFLNASNSEASEIPQFDALDANISYLYHPLNLRLAAFGKNVFNEDYNISSLQLDFGVNTYAAPLATYGVSLSWEFGGEGRN